MKKCHLLLFASLALLLALTGCQNNSERFSSRLSDSSSHSEMPESIPVLTSSTSSTSSTFSTSSEYPKPTDIPNNQEEIQNSETIKVPKNPEPIQNPEPISSSVKSSRSEIQKNNTSSQSSSSSIPQIPQKPPETAPPEQCLHEYILNSDKPSCETGGIVVYVCKKCGESYTKEIPAGTHDYVETITLKATDYSQGVKTYRCKNCQNTYTEKYSLGHVINLENGETAVVYGYWDIETANEVFKLVNEYRKQHSLCELEPSETLNETARLRALECAYFYSHTRPDGSHCFTAFPESYALAGENVGAGFKGNAQKVMNAWINSPLHNDNLLSAEFSYLGTSLFIMTDYDPQMHGGTYFSQEFICF